MRNKPLIRYSGILIVFLLLAACASHGSVSPSSGSEASSVSSIAPLVAKDPKAVDDAFLGAGKNALSAPNITVDATFNTLSISNHLDDSDGRGHRN